MKSTDSGSPGQVIIAGAMKKETSSKKESLSGDRFKNQGGEYKNEFL